MVFLVVVVLPLFRGATVSAPRQAQVLTPEEAQEPRARRGRRVPARRHGARARRPADHASIPRAAPFASVSPSFGDIAAGDRVRAQRDRVAGSPSASRTGRVRLGTVWRSSADGVDCRARSADRARRRVPVAPARLRAKSGDQRDLHRSARRGRPAVAATRCVATENLVTGEVSRRDRAARPAVRGGRGRRPRILLQNSRGDQVYLGWRDGTVRRYDLRRIAEPVAGRDPRSGARARRRADRARDSCWASSPLVASDSLGTRERLVPRAAPDAATAGRLPDDRGAPARAAPRRGVVAHRDVEPRQGAPQRQRRRARSGCGT